MDPLKPTTTAYPNRSTLDDGDPTSGVDPGPAKGTAPDGRDTCVAGNQVVSYQAPQFCTDNGYSLDNESADPRAAGDLGEQARQAALLAKFSGYAAANHAFPGSMDSGARAELSKLSANPPIPGARTEHVEYRSTIARVPPEDAFRHVLEHPNEFFGASGITLHPPVDRLVDGARVFLQEPGITPPVWAPVEVRVNPHTREIQFNTLDGHPLRGTNRFTFSPDGEGGTRVHQVSDFQLSSLVASGGSIAARKLTELGGHVPLPFEVKDPIVRQHEIWQNAHAYLADHGGR